MRLLLDPGHGNTNTGVERGAFTESKWVLEVAGMVRDMMPTGVVVQMTRTSNQRAVKLEHRGELSTVHASDLVVSIHADANDDPALSGLWCSYIGGNIAQSFAEETMRAAPPVLRARSRIKSPKMAREAGPLTARVHNVLRYHDCDAVLVECGFATNDTDREYLLLPQGKLGVASAIVAGVASAWLTMACCKNPHLARA